MISLVCDRCGSRMNLWYARVLSPQDFKQSQPDDPRNADNTVDHLCNQCRDDYREFMEYGG
jgi:hypothetical protein